MYPLKVDLSQLFTSQTESYFAAAKLQKAGRFAEKKTVNVSGVAEREQEPQNWDDMCICTL